MDITIDKKKNGENRNQILVRLTPPDTVGAQQGK